MRALLVTNPGATSTTSGTRDVLIHALRSEVDLEVATTHRRGHAAELARQARLDGVEVIVALGGDGTVNELVNGMLADGVSDKVPALAVVPGGSANVFARARSACRTTRSKPPRCCWRHCASDGPGRSDWARRTTDGSRSAPASGWTRRSFAESSGPGYAAGPRPSPCTSDQRSRST
ncbi:diacylglycerol/lipid kinase family protein [Fodinicola feengrottensis]|uniref:diacylglycerol/lipid kinase family protein n=1 Tax=Fodinicola feengrottensis TaxID=435914 RepID=UPI002441918A|nr:acylglycerol kinase family protein [Fodinicola feengrottensis]